MRTPESIRLPDPQIEYDLQNEQQLRRAVTVGLQDLRNDVVGIRDNTDKTSSLAIRRHQFLLMGA